MLDNELLILRIISLRKNANLTQSQFGAIIGTTKQGVNEIEKGRAKITLEKLVMLADYFNVPTDYLLGRTDNPEVNK